jgi:hypothetical protein
LLANIALSALDEHFDRQRRQYMGNDRQRAKRRRHGQGNRKIIRYADFVLMVSGDRHHAEALREEVAAVIAPWDRVCHRRKPGWSISMRALMSAPSTPANHRPSGRKPNRKRP